MKKSFYVTTPIYYVNDVPHIGHAYTTVAADTIARYKRLKGYDVFFLTGTDEHGQKVEKAAEAAGVKPLEFVDSIVPRFRALLDALNVSNDDFIRTTQERHKRAATNLWKEIATSGDIYLGEYEDWYCTPCENFLTEGQLVVTKCPDCGREVERLKEESYFFALSRYGERLKAFIEANPDFISPATKKNEILSFLSEGLRDLSVSRTTFTWGVSVPGDEKHIMYVWIEALTNYLTAIGYPDDKYIRYWGRAGTADSADPEGTPGESGSHEVLHLIGKDILRFHTVFWPAFLMSANVALPTKVFAHGWWTVDGAKMSKSTGNVVDPFALIEEYGVDQFRYFLLREVRFGLDGDFSIAALIRRNNSELANDLGNLLSRTVSMIEKYNGGIIPEAGQPRDEFEAPLIALFGTLEAEVESCMEKLDFYEALVKIWKRVREVNAYIEKTAPWKLAKEGQQGSAALFTVLYTLADTLRLFGLFTYPFMPKAAEGIWTQLGIAARIEKSDMGAEAAPGAVDISGCRVDKGAPLFPKIEIEPA